MDVSASSTLVSVEEYLRTSYKPACDYLDGILRQKPMHKYKHGKMQKRLCVLIDGLRTGFEAIPEQTVKVSDTRYLVPDIAVQLHGAWQEPYPMKPVHLCVEALSPLDRFSDAVAKCEEYHAWGVPYCWIVDPENEECWQYENRGRPNQISSSGSITAGPIILSHAEIFDSKSL